MRQLYLIATLDGHDVAAAKLHGRTRRVAHLHRLRRRRQDCHGGGAAGGRFSRNPRTPARAVAGRLRRPGRRGLPSVAGASSPGRPARQRPEHLELLTLHTPSLEAVLPFYATVFGWQVDAGLGAGMVRLPGYGDHLAATVDPHIHERQAFAPPGFADVRRRALGGRRPAQLGIRR